MRPAGPRAALSGLGRTADALAALKAGECAISRQSGIAGGLHEGARRRPQGRQAEPRIRRLWRRRSTRSTPRSRTRCGIWASPPPRSAIASGRPAIGRGCSARCRPATAGASWCSISSTRCIDIAAGCDKPRGAALMDGSRQWRSRRACAWSPGRTGFVGSAVARALLGRGHRVRVLARPGGDRRNLAGLPVEIAEGAMEDAPSLAARRRRLPVSVSRRRRLPAVGSRPGGDVPRQCRGHARTDDRALAAGVERIVYTSSVATLGLVAGGIADEDTPEPIRRHDRALQASKFQAEEVVRRLIAERGLPAVIVNPSTPVGPRDLKPTPTGRLILEAARGHMPGFVDTGLNIVHVDDVAAGHLAAAETGRIGERYILGGENMALAEILAEVARSGRPAGRRASKSPMPRRLPSRSAAELRRGSPARAVHHAGRGSHGAKRRCIFHRRKHRANWATGRGPARDGHRRRGRLVCGQRISGMICGEHELADATSAAESVETPSGKWRGAENFPVGSWLIRRDLRVHVHAFYRFARNADDIADNPALGRRGQDPPARPHGRGARRGAGRGCAGRRGDARRACRDRDDGAALPRRTARLPPGCRTAALSRLGRADGVLPLFGRAGRAAAARSARREPRDLARLGRAVLGVAGAQPSAGLRRGLPPARPRLPAARPTRRRRGRGRGAGRGAVEPGHCAGCSTPCSTGPPPWSPARAGWRRSVEAPGLRCECAVIVALAARLLRRLRRGDPLAARVGLGKTDFAAAFVRGILRGPAPVSDTAFDSRRRRSRRRGAARRPSGTGSRPPGPRSIGRCGCCRADRRDGMYAVYAWCREVDDIADGDAPGRAQARRARRLARRDRGALCRAAAPPRRPRAARAGAALSPAPGGFPRRHRRHGDGRARRHPRPRPRDARPLLRPRRRARSAISRSISSAIRARRRTASPTRSAARCS